MTVATALAGIAFGLALAAPPGPMNAIIAEESVVRGWTAGFRAGLGAMLADVAFFLLALAGAVSIVEELPRLRAGMITLGGLLMLYFAVDAARNAGVAFAPTETAAGGKGFQKAFVLGLTNPYQILFWLTVGVGLLESGEIDVLARTPGLGELLAGALVVQTGSATLVVGLFVGVVVWIVGFPAALVAAGRRLDSFAPIVAIVSALILAGFGAVFLYDGVTAI
jgi:Putative threonine efflux protein